MVFVHWLGHASFALYDDTEGSPCILIDPFGDGVKKFLEEPRRQVVAVLITHGHGDHVGCVAEVQKAHPACQVFCIAELGHILASEGLLNTTGMNIGGTVPLPIVGWKVTLVQAVHSSSYVTSRGVSMYAGEPCGFIIEGPGDDHPTIYHAACLDDDDIGCSLKRTPDPATRESFSPPWQNDMKIISDLYKPEIAMIPIGGRYTMDTRTVRMLRDAAYALDNLLLSVHHVIPMHYGIFPGLGGTPAELRSQLHRTDVTVHGGAAPITFRRGPGGLVQ